MMNVGIFIGGVRLSLGDEALPFALTFTLSERETPNSVGGSRSKRFVNFPADSVNTAFFEYWHDATRKGGKGADIRPARVEHNGIPVFSGVAQLEEVVLGYGSSLRRPNTFRVSFFGNNATWFELLNNTEIRALGLLPRHKNEKTVIEGKVNTDNDPDTTSWGYTLIRTVDWLTPGVVRWQELTPFVYVTQIIKQAFEDVGYKVVSDTFDTYFFKRLILPCPFVKYPDIDVQINSLTIYDLNNAHPVNNSTYQIVKLAGDVVAYNPGDVYEIATGLMTVGTQGFYRIEIYKDRSSGGSNYFHRAAINGVTQSQYTTPGESFASIDPTLTVQERVYLDAGDTVALVGYTTASPAVMGEALLIVRPDDNQEYDPNREDFVLDFSEYGNPDWKVGPMLLDLTLMFNLVWDTDYDKQTVRVECRDEAKLFTGRLADDPETIPGFYNAGNIVDWTSKVDTSKQAEHIALNNTPLYYELAHLSDSRDANIAPLEAGVELKTYDARYEFDGERYRQGRNRITTKFFSKTVHVLDRDIFASGSEPLYIPAMQAEPFGTAQTKRIEFAPRILFHEGIEYTSVTPTEYVTVNPIGSSLVNQALPLSWFAGYDYPESFNIQPQPLSFSDEVSINADSFPATGLMRKFHWASISRMGEGRKVKEWIFLTPSDILNLSFRTRILLFNKLYILETIDGYVPGRSGSTQVVLIADNLLEFYPDVQSSGIPGRIPFIRDI